MPDDQRDFYIRAGITIPNDYYDQLPELPMNHDQIWDAIEKLLVYTSLHINGRDLTGKALLHLSIITPTENDKKQKVFSISNAGDPNILAIDLLEDALERLKKKAEEDEAND